METPAHGGQTHCSPPGLVLAVQEALTLRWRSTTQWADLTKVLGRAGHPPDQQPGQVHARLHARRSQLLRPAADPGVRGPQAVRLPVPPAQCRKYLDDPDLPAKKKGAYHDWYEHGCQAHLGVLRPTSTCRRGCSPSGNSSGQPWGGCRTATSRGPTAGSRKRRVCSWPCDASAQ